MNVGEQVAHPLAVGPAAARVHEVELPEVAGQVFAADVVVRAVHGPLELGEEAFGRVGADAHRGDVPARRSGPR